MKYYTHQCRGWKCECCQVTQTLSEITQIRTVNGEYTCVIISVILVNCDTNYNTKCNTICNTKCNTICNTNCNTKYNTKYTLQSLMQYKGININNTVINRTVVQIVRMCHFLYTTKTNHEECEKATRQMSRPQTDVRVTSTH